MPLKRKSYNTRARAAAKRGRTGYANIVRLGKRARVSSMPMRRRRKVSLNYHEFSRYGAAGTLTCSGTESPASFDFKLQNVEGYNEFTTMFDQYKIRKVVMKLQLISNPDAAYPLNTTQSSAIANGVNWFPKFWYVRDYDSVDTETIAEMKQRCDAKFFVMKPNKEYSIVISPKVLVQTYRTATSTGYAPKPLWIDCAQSDVPHYGLHTVIDALGLDPAGDTEFKIRWEVKYYLAFKGVR